MRKRCGYLRARRLRHGGPAYWVLLHSPREVLFTWPCWGVGCSMWRFRYGPLAGHRSFVCKDEAVSPHSARMAKQWCSHAR